MKKLHFRTIALFFVLLLTLSAFVACDGTAGKATEASSRQNELTEETEKSRETTERSTEITTEESAEKNTDATEKNGTGETTNRTETAEITDVSTESEASQPDLDREIKLLCLGNSFSIDSLEYLHQILTDMGYEKIVLGNLAMAGCSLETHYKNLNSDAAEYLYYYNDGKGWSETTNIKPHGVIENGDWDIISIQQASHDSGIAGTYKYLPRILNKLDELEHSARYVWNMTWAYQQNSKHDAFYLYESDQIKMYQAIVTAVKKNVESDDRITAVIPAGTAIQNARASWKGDTLTRDGFHLSIPFGRYIAALTFAGVLTGESIENVNYRPAGLSEEERDLAVECAMLAIGEPYKVSVPKTPKPDEVALDSLYPLPLTFSRGYWYACDSSGRHFDLVTGSDLANMFFSTQLLDKKQLPEGSVIVLAEGWQFRPEGWIGNAPLPTAHRPGMYTNNTLVIDDVWWGDFTLRAFNVCKNPQVSLLNMNAEDMNDIIKIYVPYEPKTNDNTGFTRLDLNFSKGYWHACEPGGKQFDLITGQGLPQSFYSTKIFTKEELPVGTVITIADGWQYRPEGWIGEEQPLPSSLRPAMVTTSEIVVTEEWWGDFTKRAFNIAKIGLPALDGVTEEQMNEIFEIKIPVISVE